MLRCEVGDSGSKVCVCAGMSPPILLRPAQRTSARSAEAGSDWIMVTGVTGGCQAPASAAAHSDINIPGLVLVPVVSLAPGHPRPRASSALRHAHQERLGGCQGV